MSRSHNPPPGKLGREVTRVRCKTESLDVRLFEPLKDERSLFPNRRPIYRPGVPLCQAEFPLLDQRVFVLLWRVPVRFDLAFALDCPYFTKRFLENRHGLENSESCGQGGAYRWLIPPYRRLIQVDEHLLRFEIFLEAPRTQLAAKARLFVAWATFVSASLVVEAVVDSMT